MVQSEAAIPPSTRSTVAATPSLRTASMRSRVWNPTDSRVARASSARPLPRVRPNIAPRAPASHQGAPRPVNAGTR